MDSIDIEVLRKAVDWLQDGRRVMLVTVIKTWGSSPRPIGALAVIRDDGLLIGSVSGGCVEDDLIRRNAASDRSSTPQRLTYGVTAEDAQRFGLPCGGALALLLEPQPGVNVLSDILRIIERRELVGRRIDLTTGAMRLVPPSMKATPEEDGESITITHGPRWRLILIGAAQSSRCLAEMATALDYQVTVCDPRSEYAEAWDVPGALLDRRMPDDTVLALKPDQRTAVITLSHDPKLDDMALLEALKSDAFYVGALGSKATNKARRERLAMFDLNEREIARLRGPVGLPIGSRAPAEIAVAILAELTALRNGVVLSVQNATYTDASPQPFSRPRESVAIRDDDYRHPTRCR